MKQPESILLNLMNATFDKSTISQLESNYLPSLKQISRWMCFSDYCFDDKNKPNDVVTYSIIPYVTDYFILEAFLKENVKADIKNAKKITREYIEFLKNYPLINFSFIINDRKKLFGDTEVERKVSLTKEFTFIKELYEFWIANEPEKKDEYEKIIKKINRCLVNINKAKKLNIYIDVILVSFFGSFVSYIILNRVRKLELFGWFPDRDRIHDIEDNLVLNLFGNNVRGLLKGVPFEFAGSDAKSSSQIFYDEFIKIPDYIAGTLADYNMLENRISNDKFDTMLTEYMADNVFNNYVFKIFKENGTYNCARVKILKNIPDSADL